MGNKRLFPRLTKLRARQLLCVAAGLALGIVSAVVQRQEEQVAGGALARPGPGQESQVCSILVDGLESKSRLVEINLSPRRYGKEEADAVFKRALQELPERIAGENKSLDEVRWDLNLTASLEDYGIRLRWESEEPGVVDSFGGVHNQELPEAGKKVVLDVEMTDGWFSSSGQVRLRVLPPVLPPEEEALGIFLELVEAEDVRQQNSPSLVLPSDYEGRVLSYRRPQEPVFAKLAGLGLAAALLLSVKERSDALQAKKKREAQLMVDYPEIVSKLMIFLGAGMTIRTAWDRICGDYMMLVKKGKTKPRYAYEEMYETSCQMNKGIPEGQAYGAFGRHCGLQPYMKLCSLLEQNRKNGSRNLRDMLKLEMTDAFEQRKHGARRLGEEASTRLLFPLFLMLGVVMVMIAIPAFMEFL